MKKPAYRHGFRLGIALLLVGGALLLLGAYFEALERGSAEMTLGAPPLGAGMAVANSAPSPSPTLDLAATPVVDAPIPVEITTPTATLVDALEDAAPPPSEDISCYPSPTMARRLCAGGWPVERFSPLDGRLLVGLYGTPMGRGLGILGTVSPTKTVALALEQAAAYQTLLTDTRVVPFFHMVTTIADPYPGEDGDYNHRVVTPTIQLWIDVARAHGLLSVLDIQPAHSPLPVELAYLEPFLHQRGVHLAVDPEFMMLPGAIPGQRIGVMDGDSVNLVQAWLSERAWEAGERKLLIIHQFDDRMFVGKDRIQSFPFVELIWDADGFGGPWAKVADYLQYAQEPGFEHGGFKLFYDYDTPLMTPAEVLRLRPRPVFVVYQ